MLKSIYGFLFKNTTLLNEKPVIHTVDQFFSEAEEVEAEGEIDEAEVEGEIDEAEVEDKVEGEAEEVQMIARYSPINHELIIVNREEQVWSSTEKKWTTETETKEIPKELQLIKSISTMSELKNSISEHIVVQTQKRDEKNAIKRFVKEEKKDEEKEVKKWIPNDKLFYEHECASEAVGKVPNLLKQIKTYREKITMLQAEVDKIQNKKNLNPFDKYELIEYKKDLSTEESRISKIELELENAQRYIHDSVFEEFVLYIAETEEYIKYTELNGIMSVNDLLCSNSIYLKTRSIMDSLKYGKKNPVLLEKLNRLTTLFNMSEIYENSRGKNVKEFMDFFIKDKTNDVVYLFDNMDQEVVSSVNPESLLKMENDIKESQNSLCPPDEEQQTPYNTPYDTPDVAYYAKLER